MSAGRQDVLHDPALGMAGVFRPVQKGERGKLDITMQWGTMSLQWRGPDVLSISDQSVLFAVLEVAGEFLVDSPTEALATCDNELWELLGHQNHLFRTDSVQVATTFARLAAHCRWEAGGSADRRVRDGLKRLTETTVWAKFVGDKGEVHEGSSRLLGWQVGDRKRVTLIVNWRLAQALHGGQYARVSMLERFAMDSEAGKALHALLSCKIKPGAAFDCGLEKLQVHVWGDALTGASFRKRRGRMVDALLAINQLCGWRVEFRPASVRITRGPADPSPNALAYRSQAGVSVTRRRISSVDPASPSRQDCEKPSNGAGSGYFDLTVKASISD